MLLPLFDLATRKWEVELPFPSTLAEAMLPDLAYALIHAGAEDVDTGTLVESAAQAGYRLDFAGYALMIEQLGAAGLCMMMIMADK